MNVSIIGGGNLGSNIAKGIRSADKGINVHVSRRNAALIQHLSGSGIKVFENNIQCIQDSEIIILAVKPHQLDDVLVEIVSSIKNQIIISMVTGKNLKTIKSLLGGEVCVFRGMPNTAISQGQSMTCISTDTATEKQKLIVHALFGKLGEVEFIDEKLMDAATALGACGIAFALRYIRAATQAGIQIGFDANTALKIVAQTVNGAATLLLENHTHPEQEIDKVTTPQGCTIVGLNEMEHQGFSSAVIKGIQNSFLAIDKVGKKVES